MNIKSNELCFGLTGSVFKKLLTVFNPNRRKPTLRTSFLSVFLNAGKQQKQICYCLVYWLTVAQYLTVCFVESLSHKFWFFALFRKTSHNFAQFHGIWIHTPIIVWTVESWVFCFWIVWFILPRPQPGYTLIGHVKFRSFLAFFIPLQFRSFLAFFPAQIPLIPCIF